METSHFPLLSSPFTSVHATLRTRQQRPIFFIILLRLVLPTFTDKTHTQRPRWSLVHSCCQNQRIGASSQAFVLGFAVCNVFESEKQYGYRMLFTILLDWEFDLVPSLKHVFYHNPIFNEPYKACCSRNWNNKPPFDTFDRGCCLHKAQREISVFIVIHPRPLELQGCFSILAGLACYSRYFSHRATHDISITEVH